VKLQAAFEAGAGPDLIIDGFIRRWHARGVVDPLDAHLETLPARAVLSPVPVSFGKFDGKTWALPYITYNFTAIYNTEMFRAAGIELRPDEIIDQDRFLDLARRLTVTGPDGKVKQYGIGLLGSAHSDHLFVTLFYSTGGRLFGPDGKLIARNHRDKLVKVMSFYPEAAKYSPGGAAVAVQQAYGTTRATLGTKQVAIITDTVPAINIIETQYPDLKGKLDALLFKEPMYASEYLMWFKKTPKKEAWEFVKVLFDREVHTQFALKAGYVPPRTDVLDHPLVKLNRGAQADLRQARQGAYPHPANTVIYYDQIRRHQWDAVGAVLLGKKPVEQAVDEMLDLMYKTEAELTK
jgi:ABC-type glycerol-3-phosphate transport system substrate-binding protein